MEIVSRRVTLLHRGAPSSHTVEFVRLADGHWSSDALFAVRYGEGETVYRRALVLRAFPHQPTIIVENRDFAPFRDLPAELLGWADRMTAGIRGIPTSSAPENSDRDEVRFARLVETHLPPELVTTAAPGEPDEGILDELCACPVCPDCEEPLDPAGGSRCAECADACPPYFAPASASAPSAYAPLPGVYLHGTLEDRAGTDALLAIDAPSLVDRLLAGSTRVECEAYVMLGSTQIEAIAVLWRRGPDDVRGLVVESGDEVAIEYAEARAAELADSL
jgi:hypothetical protein